MIIKKMKYKKANKKLIRKYFSIEENDKNLILRYQNSINKIIIKKEFILDENIASLAGLMPDGCILKDLKRVYFSQKKDLSKIYLFKGLIIKLFRPTNKVFIRNNKGTYDVYFNSKTLTQFFIKILKIPDCSKQMRVPKWIFESPKSVKIAYLQQAFDMEGTILKKLCEIRFITKDKLFAYDIKRLLKQLNIESTVNRRIGGTHRTTQYRLSIYRKENFRKFKQIGFRTPFLEPRFKELTKKYKI